MSLIEKIQNSLPKYKVKVPSTGQNTFFRPFLMKEQKMLLVAQQSKDKSEILKAMTTVVENCVDDIPNVLEMPLYDLEYLFIQIRAKSVSEKSEPTFTCPATGQTVKTGINLTEVQIFKGNPKSKIKVTDKLTVEMRSPTVKDYILIDSENWFETLMARCMSKLIFEDEVFEGVSIQDEEKLEILETMTQKQYNTCVKFIDEQPYIYTDVKYRTEDGELRDIRFKGMKDFFS
jgi:hypothetical protein|tara:strand:- start:169 stop:864 length:696 start_codon:yes stop_codon:yes gene_type:complete